MFHKLSTLKFFLICGVMVFALQNVASAEQTVTDHTETSQASARIAELVAEALRAYKAGQFQQANLAFKRALVLRSIQHQALRAQDVHLSLHEVGSTTSHAQLIHQLLEQGDHFFALGDYDRAVEEYEQIFLLDPVHRTASRRIDRVRKAAINSFQAWKDSQQAEQDIVRTRRADLYVTHARELIQARRLIEARHALERATALAPKHEQARELLEMLQTVAVRQQAATSVIKGEEHETREAL